MSCGGRGENTPPLPLTKALSASQAAILLGEGREVKMATLPSPGYSTAWEPLQMGCNRHSISKGKQCYSLKVFAKALRL